MDGVWLPAGGENPRARGFPDSRHKPRPGIAKGEAFSPLVRPRQQQVGQSPQPTRAEPAKSEPAKSEPAKSEPNQTETSRHRPGQAEVDRPDHRAASAQAESQGDSHVSLSHQRQLAVIFPH